MRHTDTQGGKALDLPLVADGILSCRDAGIIRIPPVLRKRENLVKFLRFAVAYYSKGSTVSLKNAGAYIKFSPPTMSKVHLWLQQVCFGLRVSLLAGGMAPADVMAVFKVHFPKSPLVLKSALSKYKFVHVGAYSDKELLHCCQKDAESLRKTGAPSAFLDKKFADANSGAVVAESIQGLITACEELDSKGMFSLSEKVFESTKALAKKLTSS